MAGDLPLTPDILNGLQELKGEEKMVRTWLCAQDEEQCCPHEDSHTECSLQLYL